MIDESGMMLTPLVRRTLAPRGQTPILTASARRDKVSLMGALRLSSRWRQPSLHLRTYPKSHVNQTKATAFLRDLLQCIRGPMLVLWDRSPIHRGEEIRELLSRFHRLELHSLPANAPDLNLVEALWKHLKCDWFANYVPVHVHALDQVVRRYTKRLRGEYERLLSFFSIADLPFD